MQAGTIVIGENLVDLLVRDDGVEAVSGGGPMNVARALARLNTPVTFVSGVSGDAFGAEIRASLTADGVAIAADGVSNLPTTLAVVTMDPAGPRYHFHLNGTAAFAVAPLDSPAPQALYVGTLGLVVEPMASVSERAFESAPNETLRVMDPNCRPSATSDPERYRQRIRHLAALADIVKVSVEDLDFLFGPGGHDRASALLSLGARLVLVTDGPNPISVWHADYQTSVPVVAASVVDTVGAGDSFIGGFIAWWLGHHLAPTDLADEATVTAAIVAASEISRRTCERAGAQPPYAAELNSSPSWHWL